MGADQHHDWRQLAESALDWWRDAGVDTLVADQPRDWRTPANGPAATGPADAARAGAAKVADVAPAPPLPATLDAFAAWRTGPDAPEASWGAPLLAAEGDPASDLMIVVDCPEGDGLMGGAAGVLFDRILGAIGRDRASIHLAALAIARPIGGILPSESEAELTTLLRHHIALAAPKRLLLLGKSVSRALIGVDSVKARGSLHRINLEVVTVEAVASWHPRFLLERPSRKGDAWKDLQLLMGGLR
ncbi:uracil-DNA glycosylase family protein [Sphingomonas sp.]|uniref:uracil-DNA glycosylase family protein n=1 Tax=Sphingomonas sp. TaxID=28214 RepID=UPI002CCEDE1A|nr:uracil-DNA glycosylase family protein [Sphingomonas sp.]HWK36776.1 uracil-DNA glycosylase family protein [Sphingomonas sp.]